MLILNYYTTFLSVPITWYRDVLTSDVIFYFIFRLLTLTSTLMALLGESNTVYFEFDDGQLIGRRIYFVTGLASGLYT